MYQGYVAIAYVVYVCEERFACAGERDDAPCACLVAYFVRYRCSILLACGGTLALGML